jgi:hypothetical protein
MDIDVEGGIGWVLPVSRDVQPAVLKDGAKDEVCDGGSVLLGGIGTRDDVFEEVGSTDMEPTVDHPDFLKPGWETAASEGADIDVQPDLLTLADSASRILLAGAGSTDGTEEGCAAGLAILIPAAAAIFLSSFSSRLRSFSLRLSISSWGIMRCEACISLKRAL